jgi:hypothetical protein
MTYALRHLDTAALVRNYEKEGAALAFLRDVVRLGSRDAASRFVLSQEDEHGNTRVVAEGEGLAALDGSDALRRWTLSWRALSV